MIASTDDGMQSASEQHCDLIEALMADCNHRRYHKSSANLITLADVYFGRGQTILLQRGIKRQTRLQHQRQAA